jgi:hypothetical protein
LAFALGGATSAPTGLPDGLSRYREWRLVGGPSEVALGTWWLCRSPQPGEREKFEKRYGPHAKRYVKVYANEVAALALESSTRPFPKGSILAKEKLVSPDAKKSSGVAFMVKGEGGEVSEDNDWSFSFYPSNGGDVKTTHRSCVACHRAAVESDLVFGTYRSAVPAAAQQRDATDGRHGGGER